MKEKMVSIRLFCLKSRNASIFVLALLIPYMIYNIYLKRNCQNGNCLEEVQRIVRGKEVDPVDIPETCTGDIHALIIKLQSRLGNQMMQYAATLGLAAKHNLVPVVLPDSRGDIFKVFKINQTFEIPKSCQRYESVMYRQKKHANIYDKITETLGKRSREEDKNIVIEGHFANHKFFNHIEDTLREVFVLNDDIKTRALEYLNDNVPPNLKGKEYVRVGVHLRLGDRGEMWEETRQEFINKAVQFYQKRYKRILFVVCSDNIMQSQELFPKRTNVIYSVFSNKGLKNEPWYDFAVLLQCDHSLISVGTFSWWAGWLTGGDVVYHTAFPIFNSGSKRKEKLYKDFYPSHWHRIDME